MEIKWLTDGGTDRDLVKGAYDIVEGNLKLILGLVWCLILRYQIAGKTRIPPKKLMLAWLQAVLPELKIRNFTSSWNDGVALCALVDYCEPGTFTNWRSLDTTDHTANCRRAMQLAQEKFGIPQILSPEDMSSTSLDELSCMTYLSYFMKENSPGHRSTLRRVSSLLPELRIRNFNTDWNSGVALCQLVHNLGGHIPSYPHISTDATQWVKNLTTAIRAAKDLHVEPVLTAQEIADLESEHLAMMAYTAKFCNLAPVSRSKTPEEKCQLEPLSYDSYNTHQQVNIDLLFLDSTLHVSDILAYVQGPTGYDVPCNLRRTMKGAVISFVPLEIGQFQVIIPSASRAVQYTVMVLLILSTLLMAIDMIVIIYDCFNFRGLFMQRQLQTDYSEDLPAQSNAENQETSSQENSVSTIELGGISGNSEVDLVTRNTNDRPSSISFIVGGIRMRIKGSRNEIRLIRKFGNMATARKNSILQVFAALFQDCFLFGAMWFIKTHSCHVRLATYQDEIADSLFQWRLDIAFSIITVVNASLNVLSIFVSFCWEPLRAYFHHEDKTKRQIGGEKFYKQVVRQQRDNLLHFSMGVIMMIGFVAAIAQGVSWLSRKLDYKPTVSSPTQNFSLSSSWNFPVTEPETSDSELGQLDYFSNTIQQLLSDNRTETHIFEWGSGKTQSYSWQYHNETTENFRYEVPCRKLLPEDVLMTLETKYNPEITNCSVIMAGRWIADTVLILELNVGYQMRFQDESCSCKSFSEYANFTLVGNSYEMTLFNISTNMNSSRTRAENGNLLNLMGDLEDSQSSFLHPRADNQSAFVKERDSDDNFWKLVINAKLCSPEYVKPNKNISLCCCNHTCHKLLG